MPDDKCKDCDYYEENGDLCRRWPNDLLYPRHVDPEQKPCGEFIKEGGQQ